MKSSGAIATLVVMLASMLALCTKSRGFFSGLFFVPFALGPLLVSLGLALRLKGRKRSQAVLAIGSVLYALWFGYAYADIFYLHPDPQAPIAWLFVGAYSLPVMIPVWVIASLSDRPKPGEIKAGK